MHDIPRILWLFSFLLTVQKIRSEPQVYILSENLEQVVTSSTLQWVPYTGRLDVLKNAVVAAHQFKMIENAANAEGDQEIVKVPIYVCRAKVAALWVPGQLLENENQCVVSLYRKVSSEKNFEILINREKRARINWILKNRFTLTPQGGVEGGDKIYIARRSVKYHEKDGALTHTVGYFNPSENLGVFSLVDQNNNELKYEEGEILVEQEPIRYEFSHTEFDRIKSRHRNEPKILGEIVLKNEESEVQKVETVIAYNYTHYMNWGKDHGLLIALPFKLSLKNGTTFEGKWGIPESMEKTEVVPIEQYLEEGTAVNVTLKGNYTESDIPYITTVTAFFKDEFILSTTLKDSLRMKHMTGVVPEFSPVYFISNRSLVPTTTTTVRTTTTITTQKTQTTNSIKITPNTEDVYVLDNKSEKTIDRNEIPTDNSNDSNVIQQLTKKTDGSSGSFFAACNLLLILSFVSIRILAA